MFVMTSFPPIFRAGGGNKARVAIHFTRAASPRHNQSCANPPCRLPVHARQTPPHETIPRGRHAPPRRNVLGPTRCLPCAASPSRAFLCGLAHCLPHHRNSFAATRRFPAPRHPDPNHFFASPTCLTRRKCPLQEMSWAEQPNPVPPHATLHQQHETMANTPLRLLSSIIRDQSPTNRVAWTRPTG